MKRTYFLWVLLGVVALGAKFVPDPGIRETVFSIAPVPGEQGTLLVGARRGLYRSSGQGGGWKRVFSSGIWGGSVQAVAVAPGKPAAVYLAAGSRVYRSFDGRDRWQSVFQGTSLVHCVVVDPRDSRHLLLGTEQGLYASTDQGVTWSPIHQGMPVGPVRRTVFHPTQGGFCYALAEGGLFRSEDRGVTWVRVKVFSRSDSDLSSQEEEGSEESRPVLTGAFAADPFSGAIYVGTANGIFVGRPDGTNWSAVPTVGLGTPGVTDLVVDPRDSGRLYAATPRGLFSFSRQTGLWVRLQEELPAGAVRSVVFNPEDRSFWVGMESGLYHAALENPQGMGAPGVSFAHAEQGSSIQEVHQAAIRYAEVMPGKIRGWRSGAMWRNWLPKFTVSLDRSKDQTIASSSSSGKTIFSVGPEDESFKVGFGFTWDFANLIWNPDQVSIDTRSRLMVQLRQDILEEVTRLYFERRRLCAEFQGNPSGDAVLIRERQLRVEELTAQLDALTGGWFSLHK